MGKYDRALDWEKMEEAQAPDYIPPKEELAGLSSVVQEQYEARATPTVSTQNQAYTDFIEANQESYTQIVNPPSNERSHDQWMMDTQNELEAEQEAEITRPPDADNIFSDILTNLAQAEQASSDAVRTWRETPEEELPENIARGRNLMDDVTFGALAALLGFNPKSEVENILQLGDAAQSFMDEVRADSVTMTAKEYNDKYGTVVESPIDLQWLRDTYNMDVNPELLSFSEWASQTLGLPEIAKNPIDLQRSIQANLDRNVVSGWDEDLLGDWPSEYYRETLGGEVVVSGNQAKAEIAENIFNPETQELGVNPGIVASKGPPAGQAQDAEMGIQGLTTPDVYSFVSTDKDTRFDGSSYVYDKTQDMVNNQLGYYEKLLDSEGENYQPDRVNMAVTKAGIVSNRPVFVVEVSDSYGGLQPKEVMVYISSGTGAPELKQEGDVIAITGLSSNGWFEKNEQQINKTLGSAVFNAAEDLVRGIRDAGHWSADWYNQYKLFGDGAHFD